MDPKERMKVLVDQLNEAAKAYYSEEKELMTNLEYDTLYDELLALEQETGIILAGSPTQKVGYEIVSELPKVRHTVPMKSLDKTKDLGALQTFLGNEKGMLSWKLDGLTVVLTYEGGELVQAATRGNGEEGEVITSNARVFEGVPIRIPFDGHLVVRGEALISYEDFRKINEQLPPDEQYKNPRNLCSGSVRQLDSRIAKERHVHVIVYTFIEADVDMERFHDSKEQELIWLKELGFDPTPYRMVSSETLPEAEKAFTESVDCYAYPVDGLVLTMDSISRSASLGSTAKFPRDSMAFKWQDEQASTHLLEVEWSPSRTGLINPVAIFEPVELEGTTVKRASIHNVSIIRELKLGIGDTITVYKANMIIPQIAQNLTQSDTLPIPEHCPRCGGPTEVLSRDDVQVLICTNPSCPAKSLKALEHFVSRAGMNIDGISEAIIERLSDQGILNCFGDLYRLGEHRDEIEQMEGFGAKSCDKLLAAVDASRKTELFRLLAAIGIPGIGTAAARLLADAAGQDIRVLREADEEFLSSIEGIGPVMAGDIFRFFRQEENIAMLDDILAYLEFARPADGQEEKPLAGKTFVITGSLNHFENRDALKEKLISLGAKVAGSVSRNTTYLVNNDAASTSSKNKKAKELGVPVITEEELLAILH